MESWPDWQHHFRVSGCLGLRCHRGFVSHPCPLLRSPNASTGPLKERHCPGSITLSFGDLSAVTLCLCLSAPSLSLFSFFHISLTISLSPLCFLPHPWAPLCLYWVLNPEPAVFFPSFCFHIHTLSPSPSVSLLPPHVTDWLRTLEICRETHDVAG